MNPEVSPWMLIADRQRKMDLKREEEQKILKNQIRLQYHKQLAQQVQQQRQQKLRKIQEEKKWEKQLVDRSIESQQRIIELQKMKALASNQRQSRLDMENDIYKAARMERQNYIAQTSRHIQNQLNRQAEMRHREEYEKMERKKKQLRQDLKETMEYKNNYQKYRKQREKDFENYKIAENQILLQRDQKNRRDYLERLKKKAATIDYGAHQSFQRNHEKSLVQKKKQEWERQKEYIERAKMANLSDLEYRKFKQSLENNYRGELKKQLEEQSRVKRQSILRQVEQDHETIQRYQDYTKSVDLQKKKVDEKNRKELLHFLQMQVEESQQVKKVDPYVMRDRDYIMNADILRGSKVNIPGETYELDHGRKKQLQYVARSMSQSPVKTQTNYLADRGRNILN